jgi:KaiC/GvpD/RAD55 family RecA-like ATPase
MRTCLKRTTLSAMFKIPSILCRHLEEAGFSTVELLAATTVDELEARTGIQPHHAEELIQKADELVRPKSGFKTAPEVEEEQVKEIRFSTGVASLDDSLGRGFHLGSIVMIHGPQWSGKTLLCAQLAVMAQQVATDDGSFPKVIWYDADGSFNIKTIKEIAFRMRMNPELVAENVVLVDVYRNGEMELFLETMRRVLLRNHVSLVVIDSLYNARKCLESSAKPSDLTQPFLRLATKTGIVFVTTSNVRTRISDAVSSRSAYYRSLSIVDYILGLQLRGEKERWISIDKAGCGTGGILYLGHGGFFGDLRTKNTEVRRVGRYLRRTE